MKPLHDTIPSADLHTVHAMSLALLDAPSPREGLHRALDILQAAVEPDLTALFSLHDGTLQVEAIRGLPPGVEDKLTSHFLEGCLCGKLAQNGSSIILDDIHNESRCAPGSCLIGSIRALGVFPLRAGGQLLGLLNVGSYTTGHFGPQADLLESMASVLALGVRNAGLNDDLASRIHALESATSQARHNENLYRTILDNAPVMIDTFDPDGNFSYWNKECERVLGYNLAEVAKHGDPMELIYPDALSRKKARTNIARASGEFIDYIVQVKGGEQRAQRWADFKLEDGSVVGIGIDVTEERAAALALQQAHTQLESLVEERTKALQETVAHLHEEMRAKEASQQALNRQAELLRTVLSHIPYYVFWKDTSNRYLGCNPQFAKLADLASPDDIVGKSDFDLPSTRTEAEYFQRIDNEVIQTGVAKLHFTEPQTLADGRSIVLETSKVPLRDSEGSVVGVLGISADITTRIRLEEELKASEEKYRMLYSSMPDGFVSADLDGHLLDWNPAYATLLGYSDAELASLDCKELTPEKWRDFEQDILKKIVVGQGKNAIYEKEYFSKHGTIIPVALHSFVLRDKDGQPEILATVVRDISTQKRMEHSILNAKVKAEEASQAKTDFMARMSHEIRTPMNAILGITQLADDADTVDQYREALQVVRDAASSLMAILNDILDFSRIESHGVELSPVPTMWDRLLQSIVTSLASQAKAKGIALLLDIHPESPPAVLADTDRLRQVLFNLVHNAIKFTEQGKVSISLHWQQSYKQRVGVCVYVEDTGIGIAQEKLPHIFNPFYQADGGFSRSHGGSGLGLAISKQLVERMGGQLTARSTPGKGSLFIFRGTFPEAEASGELQNEQDSEQAAASEVLQGARILLVEDNALNIKVAEAMLKKLGCNVTVAEHGRGALELLAQKPFDVILLDIEMPGMDGFEVAKRLIDGKSGAAAATIPRIAMTAHAMKGYKELCLRRGMQDYIAKPINLHALQRTLIKHIRKSSSAAGTPVPASGEKPPAMAQTGSTDQSPEVDTVQQELDIPKALERFDGDSGLLRNVMEMLGEELPARRAKLQEALANNDLEAVQRLAHNLTSALGMAGAKNAASLAGDLSDAAHAQDARACQELAVQLEGVLDALAPAMRQALAQHAALQDQ